MWSVIKEIYRLITKQNKFKFKILVILIFLTSIFEIIGLALILPFLFLVNNLNIVYTNEYINRFYQYLHFDTSMNFLYFIGGMAMLFSFLGMVLSIYTNIKLTKFSNDLGADFSIRLLNLYLNNTYETLSSEKFKEKRKKIVTDTAIVANNIILPSLMIIAKTMLVCILCLGLFLISYEVTFFLFMILFSIYIFIFNISNKKVKLNNKNIERIKKEKNLLILDTLKNISTKEKSEKDIYIKQFFTQVYQLSKYQSFNNTVAKLPRYLLMFLVLSAVIGVSIYLLHAYQGNMDNIIHKMLFFIIIGLKLLPQIQNIFINYLKLKSNIYAFENIKNDLYKTSA